MEMEIGITKATIDDLEDVVRLFNDYRMFYKQPHNIEGARVFIRERIVAEESVIFIARDVLTLDAVGFTQLYPVFSSQSMQRLWILNDLYVAEAARRKGVAARLLETARAFSQNSAAKGLLLCTQTTNTGAQALYRKCGYVQNEEFYWFFLKT